MSFVDSMNCSSNLEEINLDKFRKLIKCYIERHHYSAALYWADKIVTLGNNTPVDIYWLAQCYFLTKQYHRAIHLINQHSLIRNSSCRYLVARCHYEVGQYQSTLDILENSTDGFSNDIKIPLSIPEIDDTVSIQCSMYLLKGYAQEASDNRALAADSFRAAIKADPLCYEAVHALTRHHMLTREEEEKIVSNLSLSLCCKSDSEANIIQSIYDTCVNKYSAITKPPSPEVPCILQDNLDFITAKAERLYYQCDFNQCFSLTQEVLRKDPFHTDCLPVHISCLVELKKPNALFLLGHKLVDLYPESALSWYAVGCYYYLIGKNDNARRYLCKATSLDKVFGPAWIAYGHSFAAENEHDQAMAAYFKANQQMKGCHLPLLYIGMEYSLTNNPKIAEKFFKEALEISPDDPFVLQELGVVAFYNLDFEGSEKYLRKAVEVVEESGITIVPKKWSTLLNNLAHACRKNNHLEEALHFHQQALRFCPGVASTYSDIGLVQSMMGKYEEAVVTLHKALSLHRDQTTTTTLLHIVMEQLISQDTPFQGDGNISDLQLANEISGIDSSANLSFSSNVNSSIDMNMMIGNSIGNPVMHSSKIVNDSLDQSPQPVESSSAMVIEELIMDEDSPYSPADKY